MLIENALVLNEYRVLYKITSSDVSTIYRAVRMDDLTDWVIKEVTKKGLSYYDQIEMAKQTYVAREEMSARELAAKVHMNNRNPILSMDVDILKSLEHEHLNKVVDVVETEDATLIILEYIYGMNLEEVINEEMRIKKRFLKEKDIISWGEEMCSVVNYLHEQENPIIYYNIKPENIMLMPDLTIKLIDLAIARTYKSDLRAEKAVGTEGYAAPELANGATHIVDQRVDIYGIGATLYHMATAQKLDDVKNFTPVRKLNPSISKSLEKVIHTCLEEDPDDRYQSCEQVYYQLRKCPTRESFSLMKKNSLARLYLFYCMAIVTFASATTSLVLFSIDKAGYVINYTTFKTFNILSIVLATCTTLLFFMLRIPFIWVNHRRERKQERMSDTYAVFEKKE